MNNIHYCRDCLKEMNLIRKCKTKFKPDFGTCAICKADKTIFNVQDYQRNVQVKKRGKPSNNAPREVFIPRFAGGWPEHMRFDDK